MGSSAVDAMMERAGWTVPGLLSVRSADSPNEPALWQLAADEQWVASRWADYRQAVASLANGFRKLGLAPGDRVAILAPSSKEWDYVQLAILAAGGVAVGLVGLRRRPVLLIGPGQRGPLGVHLRHPPEPLRGGPCPLAHEGD